MVGYVTHINQVSNKQVGIMFNSDQVTDSLFYVYLPLFSVYLGEHCNPFMNVCKFCCIKSTILRIDTSGLRPYQKKGDISWSK